MQKPRRVQLIRQPVPACIYISEFGAKKCSLKQAEILRLKMSARAGTHGYIAGDTGVDPNAYVHYMIMSMYV